MGQRIYTHKQKINKQITNIYIIIYININIKLQVILFQFDSMYEILFSVFANSHGFSFCYRFESSPLEVIETATPVIPRHSNVWYIYTYIYYKHQPNVGKYTIDWVSGIVNCNFYFCTFQLWVHWWCGLTFKRWTSSISFIPVSEDTCTKQNHHNIERMIAEILPHLECVNTANKKNMG